jgi:5-methylcytosine-specific restriction endonuclease McrA
MVFVANSPYTNSSGVVRRLLGMGWSYTCHECGVANWRGRRLTLHLEHINGIHNDHRLLNLRFLCPNCHSQTSTYGNRTRDVPL